MNEQPNYYAIIPASIRYDEKLLKGSVLLYGEITALSNQKGFCWASDNYFAELYGVDKRSIQRWLSSLEENGYINRIVQKEGKKIVSRSIKLGDKNVSNLVTKTSYPSDKNVRENSTSINTTNNNTHNKTPSKAKPLESDLKNQFAEIWEIYPKRPRGNKKTSFTKYKKAIKDGVKHDDIKSGLNSYIKQLKAHGTDNKYIKNADTWFNQAGWDDEYTTQSSGTIGNQDLKKAYGDWDF
ncbi:DNA replication protein DnaD (DnaD) [Fructobacillus tropaeoli]|uniref:helix-turn-helix domain-containing protein n=1 Tax=Fructobacillus tropaeoli TaxID=709323 RepID=UPI002D8446D3|nr:DNA replication protein DnaD (DnaD) [Fructobacillus tropaeoli]